MSTTPQPFPDLQELFDAEGRCLGAFLGPEAWPLVREAVLAALPAGPRQDQPAPEPEPLEDWHALVAHWDFRYPVDLDVACPVCGSASADWERDVPRKFVLTAANMGGLVSFRCLSCQAKVIKRHFYDVIKVESVPFAPERCARNKGRGA